MKTPNRSKTKTFGDLKTGDKVWYERWEFLGNTESKFLVVECVSEDYFDCDSVNIKFIGLAPIKLKKQNFSFILDCQYSKTTIFIPEYETEVKNDEPKETPKKQTNNNFNIISW